MPCVSLNGDNFLQNKTTKLYWLSPFDILQRLFSIFDKMLVTPYSTKIRLFMHFCSKRYFMAEKNYGNEQSFHSNLVLMYKSEEELHYRKSWINNLYCSFWHKWNSIQHNKLLGVACPHKYFTDYSAIFSKGYHLE